MKLKTRSLRHWFDVDTYKREARDDAFSVLHRWDVPTVPSTKGRLPPDLDQLLNIMPMDASRAHARNKIIPEEFIDGTRMNPVVVLLSLAFWLSALCSAVAGNWMGWGLLSLALLPLGWLVLFVSNRLIEYTGGTLHTLDHARVFMRLQGFLVFATLSKVIALWALVQTNTLTTPTEFVLASVGANLAFTLGATVMYGSEKAYKKGGEDKYEYKPTVARDTMRFAWHANLLRNTVFACVLLSPVLAKCVLAAGMALVPKFVSHEYTIKRQLRLTQRHYKED